MKRKLVEFENIINYRFKDKKILTTGLTHSSYANEANNSTINSNERLEFLGDSILDFIISEYIYIKYPKLSEGELTKIRSQTVCELSLSTIAKKIKLGNYLLLGKGEELSGGRNRPSILADAFEAIVAALYMDGGISFVNKWVISQLQDTIIQATKGTAFIDYKTLLQETIQKKNNISIEYKLVNETGPDHDRIFYVEIIYNNIKTIGKGKGKNKKEAEQNAAKEALTVL